MTLSGPSPDDVRHLHLEAHQIQNQQHLITAAAITTFGVVVAWHLPDVESGPVTLTSPFTLHGAFLLLVLLLLLFLWSASLDGIARSHAEYLVMHQQTGWEADHRGYRERYAPLGYFGIQGVVFITLGFLAAVFPIYLYGVRALWARFPYLFLELLAALLIYEGIVIARAIIGWPDAGRRARERWTALRDDHIPAAAPDAVPAPPPSP